MEFFKEGTNVIVKGANLKAKTIGVCARGKLNDQVEYELVYWLNGERRTQWVLDFEIELATETKQAGFVSYPTNSTPQISKP